MAYFIFMLCEQDWVTILAPLAGHDHDHDAYYHDRNTGYIFLLIDDNVPLKNIFLFSRPDINTFVGCLSTVLQFA